LQRALTTRIILDVGTDDRQQARAKDLSGKTKFSSWPGLSRPSTPFPLLRR